MGRKPRCEVPGGSGSSPTVTSYRTPRWSSNALRSKGKELGCRGTHSTIPERACPERGRKSSREGAESNPASFRAEEKTLEDDFVDAKAPAIQKLQTTSTSFKQLARYQWLTKCHKTTDLRRMRHRVRDQEAGGSNPLAPTNLSFVFSLYSWR